MTTKSEGILTNMIMLTPLFIVFNFSLSIIWDINFFNLLIPLLLLLIVFLLTLNEFTNKENKIIFIFITMLKTSFLIYQAKYKSLPMGGNDWSGYLRHANNLLSESNNFMDLIIIPDVNLFSRIMSVIFFVFENNIVLMNIFVFICSLLLVKFTHKTAILIAENKIVADTSALLINIWPISFVFGITVLRETPIQLSFILFLYFFIKYLKENKYKNFFLALIFAIIAAIFHSGMISLVIVIITILCFYDIKNKKVGIKTNQLIYTLLILVIAFISPLSNIMLSKFDSVNDIDDFIEASSYSAGNTAYMNKSANSIKDVIIQSPYRIVMFSNAPFPWQINSSGTFIAWLIDGIPRIVLIWGIANWLKRFKPKNDFERVIKFSILFIIFSTYLIHALGTANYGTAMRHRAKVLSIEIIILVWGIILRKKKGIRYDKI